VREQIGLVGGNLRAHKKGPTVRNTILAAE